MKRLLWAFLLLLCMASAAGGEEKYSLSGIARFDEGEVIFLSLYTKERFENFRKSPLPPPPFTLVLELSPEEKAAGRAAFRFEGIPRGTYALIAFRDNKKPGPAGLPDKPASAYRMMAFSGTWEDAKMELRRDIRGVEIRFGK